MGPRLWRMAIQLRRCEAAWIYGLWRRERLTKYFEFAWENYSDVYAHDYLTLLQAVLDDSVVGDDRTTFYQVVGGRTRRKSVTSKEATEDRIARLIETRDRYIIACETVLREQKFSSFEKATLGPLVYWYAVTRVSAPPVKIARLRAKAWAEKWF